MGVLPGSGNDPGPNARSAPAGSVTVEARKVVWECPTTSLSRNTMLTLASSIVIIRGGSSRPGAWSLVGSTMGSLTWIKTQ